MSTIARTRGAYVARDDQPFALPCPVIECGSMTALLELLLTPTTLLLMPIERRMAVMGRIDTTFAIHVTACTKDERGESTLLFATFVAASCSTIGGHGTLVVPVEEHGPATSILQRAHHLQDDLQRCLERALADHPRVERVQASARHRIPDEWIWANGTLDASGITFQLDHWTYLQPLNADPN